MAHVICEPCIGTKAGACVAVCPMQCIHEAADCGGEPARGDQMLYIDPELCIDCRACASACPAEAIYQEYDVPPKWRAYIDINADAFEV